MTAPNEPIRPGKAGSKVRPPQAGKTLLHRSLVFSKESPSTKEKVSLRTHSLKEVARRTTMQRLRPTRPSYRQPGRHEAVADCRTCKQEGSKRQTHCQVMDRLRSATRVRAQTSPARRESELAGATVFQKLRRVRFRTASGKTKARQKSDTATSQVQRARSKRRVVRRHCLLSLAIPGCLIKSAVDLFSPAKLRTRTRAKSSLSGTSGKTGRAPIQPTPTARPHAPSRPSRKS